jgi:hypothetical protein
MNRVARHDGGRVEQVVESPMSIEGVWTGEVYGPFGWDNRGVFVFENGRIIGGDNRQYSSGTYRVTGDQVHARIVVHYYGPPRAIFGETNERFTTVIDGKLSDQVIEGVIRRPDKPKFDLQVRLTKRMDLPRG